MINDGLCYLITYITSDRHIHHYKNEHNAFGVSSTLWDHVFGTMYYLKNEKEDKENVEERMVGRK